LLFRTYNKSEVSKLINQPIRNLDSLTEENIQYYKSIFENKYLLDKDFVFFTGAFMTGGLKKGNAFIVSPYTRRKVTLILPDGTKSIRDYIEARDICNSNDNYYIEEWEKNIPTRMLRLVKKFYDNGSLEKILNAKTQLDVYNELLTVNGFSKFLGYQVYVDLTYIPEFKFSENEFTISGPGCDRGLSYTFLDTDGMNPDECLFWLRDNIIDEFKKRGMIYDPNTLFDHLPEEERFLSVMALENSQCELSKMVKFYRKEGRPRKGYIPTDLIINSTTYDDFT
jgi:hypothetical protein